MGTWGTGAFENDGAADFLEDFAASPARAITRALRTIADAAPTEYLEVDDGTAAWAACELVALAFGQGDIAALDAHILDPLERLKPSEAHRVLALSILPRLCDHATSELAGLWGEDVAAQGPERATSAKALDDLAARLRAASKGPRVIPKPKPGDVLALPAGDTPAAGFIVVQVVGTSEIAVFEGTFTSDAEALARVKTGAARRVLAAVVRLHRRARMLANVPLHKALKGKKLYAHDTGSLGEYMLATAAVSGAQMVSYEQASTFDLAEHHDESAVRDVALGRKPAARVRTPDEHEAAIRAQHATEWAESRANTTPGPFGDVARVERFVKWTEDYGVENAIARMRDIAIGAQGYGRPSEDSERRPYIFAGIVALWRGTLPADTWPASLRERLPPAPDAGLLITATTAARVLAEQIITRDSALRMIWEVAPDEGAALRAWVARLRAALED